jgi:hypothetical protein
MPSEVGTALPFLPKAEVAVELAPAGVGVFGVLFVAVAARIVGIVGVSSQPTSGITLVTLIAIASLFAAAGWTDGDARAAVLTVGTIVAIAASKAGDISQDLKTGWLVGATPARQQLGQLIGAAFACWGVAATVLLLGSVYTFGTKEIPAPQAMLMKTIIEGVLSGALPWGLVLTGAGLSFAVILCGISGLAFAIGVYLPLASMAPIFVGGCARGLVERSRQGHPPEGSDGGVLAASGLVAGEGLAGVLVAAFVALGVAPKGRPPFVAGLPGEALTTLGILAVCAFMYRAGAKRGAGRASTRPHGPAQLGGPGARIGVALFGRGAHDFPGDLRIGAVRVSRRERLLHAPVLARVERQNRGAAAGGEAVGQIAEERLERGQLVVDEDADRLKGALEGRFLCFGRVTGRQSFVGGIHRSRNVRSV